MLIDLILITGINMDFKVGLVLAFRFMKTMTDFDPIRTVYDHLSGRQPVALLVRLTIVLPKCKFLTVQRYAKVQLLLINSTTFVEINHSKLKNHEDGVSNPN